MDPEKISRIFRQKFNVLFLFFNDLVKNTDNKKVDEINVNKYENIGWSLTFSCTYEQ